ncbi:unnamed protein product [Ilex paraguariensis]|uniref:Uncharacterized protein n=1 Tax=Ilex paraguariensis TaxID=185542 RepID=A0ABC8QZA1_9AQUA
MTMASLKSRSRVGYVVAKMTAGTTPYPSSLLAIANALALSVAVYIFATISGGHVNPAVTFEMAIGGHISIPMIVFYWISQMFGSVIACLLLRITNVAERHDDLRCGFSTAGDPRCGSLGAIGPLAIGFIAGANVLEAVYWVEPLFGAAILYEHVVFPIQTSVSLGDIAYGIGV